MDSRVGILSSSTMLQPTEAQKSQPLTFTSFYQATSALFDLRVQFSKESDALSASLHSWIKDFIEGSRENPSFSLDEAIQHTDKMLIALLALLSNPLEPSKTLIDEVMVDSEGWLWELSAFEEYSALCHELELPLNSPFGGNALIAEKHPFATAMSLWLRAMPTEEFESMAPLSSLQSIVLAPNLDPRAKYFFYQTAARKARWKKQALIAQAKLVGTLDRTNRVTNQMKALSVYQEQRQKEREELRERELSQQLQVVDQQCQSKVAVWKGRFSDLQGQLQNERERVKQTEKLVDELQEQMAQEAQSQEKINSEHEAKVEARLKDLDEKLEQNEKMHNVKIAEISERIFNAEERNETLEKCIEGQKVTIKQYDASLASLHRQMNAMQDEMAHLAKKANRPWWKQIF